MKIILLLLSILATSFADAQTGGLNAFPFLDLMYNAREASLGGDYLTGYGDDVNMGVSNPSLLNPEMHKMVSVNQSLLAGGINYGMFNYGFGIKDQGTMVAYIKYVNYGKMDRLEANGLGEGTFSPFEMIAGAGYGKQINKRISVGVKTNLIYSQLETYSSFGASVDLAGTIRNDEKGYLFTAHVKNFGYQFKAHTTGNRAPLPVEFQLAGAYKLPHAPFRFTLLAHHLNKWDITYNDPNLVPTIDPLTGDSIPVKRAGFFEKLGHHFTYQLEMDLGKVLRIRTAFDYHRRKELALSSRPGAAGFSFGLGLHFSKFRLDYGFIIYSRSGFNNILTLSSNLSKWRK
ncbi:MAG: hypothetical protein ACI837_001296 [Crocinitomicaceae bacterium]|jgi:hypothetical protein